MAKQEKKSGKSTSRTSPKSPGEERTMEDKLHSLDTARLGKYLKFLRKAKGLTRKQMAERISATENYVFMYETDRSGIGWGMLDKIGAVLGIPSSWILFIASPDEAPGVPDEVNKKIRDTKDSLLGLIHSKPLTMDSLSEAMRQARKDRRDS